MDPIELLDDEPKQEAIPDTGARHFPCAMFLGLPRMNEQKDPVAGSEPGEVLRNVVGLACQQSAVPRHARSYVANRNHR
jgi:hypothetical protein